MAPGTTIAPPAGDRTNWPRAWGSTSRGVSWDEFRFFSVEKVGKHEKNMGRSLENWGNPMEIMGKSWEHDDEFLPKKVVETWNGWGFAIQMAISLGHYV